MIRFPEIWNIIKCHMPTSEWIPLQNIYELVSRNGRLDDENFEPQSSISDSPKWKRNIRNVLQYQKRTGKIDWDGDIHYRIT